MVTEDFKNVKNSKDTDNPEAKDNNQDKETKGAKDLKTKKFEITKEKKVILDYPKDKENYNLILQLWSNDIISMNVTKEDQICEYFYEDRMSIEDIKKLYPLLLNLCKSIPNIYTLLSDFFDDNKFKIKEITPSKFILETTVQVSRSLNYPLEIQLNKKKCKSDDTIRMLCEVLTKLKNEKNKIPEFSLNKFTMTCQNSYSNGTNSYCTNKANNWKFTSSELNLSGNNVIISQNMENNIIIFFGNHAPPNSYYSPLSENSGNREGVYYDNKYVCPAKYYYSYNNGSYSYYYNDTKVLCLYGKLKV